LYLEVAMRQLEKMCAVLMAQMVPKLLMQLV
jgi:hypothetical protein